MNPTSPVPTPCPRHDGGRLAGLLASERGYTLAELSVALAVAAVATSIALFLFISISAALERGQREAEVARTAHAAWRHLSGELRRADRVAPTAGGWTVTLGDSSVVYSATEALARNGRTLLPTPGLTLSAGLAPVTVGDSLIAHRLDLAAQRQRGAEASPDSALRLGSVVRLRARSTWPEAAGR